MKHVNNKMMSGRRTADLEWKKAIESLGGKNTFNQLSTNSCLSCFYKSLFYSIFFLFYSRNHYECHTNAGEKCWQRMQAYILYFAWKHLSNIPFEAFFAILRHFVAFSSFRWFFFWNGASKIVDIRLISCEPSTIL